MLHRSRKPRSGSCPRHAAILRLETLELRANPSTLSVGGPHPNFTSIQAAVNAAHSGDHIKVYPGTYHEQVLIPSKLSNLDLEAVGPTDTVKIAPTSFAADPTTEAVIHDAGAKNVRIHGFLITG